MFFFLIVDNESNSQLFINYRLLLITSIINTKPPILPFLIQLRWLAIVEKTLLLCCLSWSCTLHVECILGSYARRSSPSSIRTI